MRTPLLLFFVAVSIFSRAAEYYVSVNGNDTTGDGTKQRPWRTIVHAISQAKGTETYTITISAGTFYLSSAVTVPPNVSLKGAGTDATILASKESFFYYPSNPGFQPSRFLLRLDGPPSKGNKQSLSDFTIDGSSKKLHGGIYVNNRSNIIIKNVEVRNTNFCGIWILHSTNIALHKVTLLDCAWASNSWCSGAFQFAHLDSVEISQLDINEGRGYGIKSLPHDKDHQLRRFKLHDSKISVNPKGVWQNGKAPNIAVEIWAASFIDSEIYNCYFDNHVSIVNADHTAEPTGDVFRIHRNFFDIAGRANGQGYGIELDIHNAEIDHNIFKGGYCGIANWSNPKTNWSIHHNIFFGQASPFPAGIINLHNGNMQNVSIYNNTAELSGEPSISFLECGEGGLSNDIDIKNNLVINSGSAKRKLIALRKGATIRDLVVENNLLYNLSLEDCTGVVRQNIFEDPGIMRVGSRPFPYYLPAPNSPLLKAGAFMKTSSRDNPPDIGAYEKR